MCSDGVEGGKWSEVATVAGFAEAREGACRGLLERSCCITHNFKDLALSFTTNQHRTGTGREEALLWCPQIYKFFALLDKTKQSNKQTNAARQQGRRLGHLELRPKQLAMLAIQILD